MTRSYYKQAQVLSQKLSDRVIGRTDGSHRPKGAKSKTARNRNCATCGEHSSNGCTFDASASDGGEVMPVSYDSVLKKDQGRKKNVHVSAHLE
jgi:hypothetical protein